MRLHRAASTLIDFASRPLCVALAIAYAAALMLPGIFLNRVSNSYSFLVSMDYHYAVALGSSLHLVLDPSASIEALRVNFGLLLSLTTAGLVKAFHIETFAGWLRLVQVFQCLFFACALVAAWFLERNKRLLFVVMMTAAPWTSTIVQSVIGCTGSALRFFNFAVLLLVLWWLKSTKGLMSALVAGAAIGFFILWNPETGIACTAAVLAAVVLTSVFNKASPIATVALAALTLLIGAAVMTAGYLLIVGGLGSPVLLLDHFIGHMEGYNAHPLGFHPIAIACALYASVVLIYSCLALRDGSDDARLIARASIATAMIVWFAYFLQFQHPTRLYFMVFMLSFTIAPLLERKYAVAQLCFWALIAYLSGVEFTNNPARFGPAAPNFQGIVLPADTATYLDDHAKRLKNLPANAIYLASTPFSMALASGRTNNFPVFDPFGETWSEGLLRQLTQEMYAHDPSCVAIEAADSPLLALSPPRAEFFERLRRSVPDRYRNRTAESGWDIRCQ